MLVKVRFLSKGLAAIGNGADEGPLTCVRPQVVQEIMHLPKHHIALRMVTFHQSVPATGPRVQVLVNTKFVALEHPAPQLYLTEVDGFFAELES